MIKKNRNKLIITSGIILLPIFVGLGLWNVLPAQFATHWGADGRADGFTDKALGIFLLPLILLACHWLCVLVTVVDPGNKKQSNKVFGMMMWICPVMSVLLNGMTYALALGAEIGVMAAVPVLLGVLFVVFGNYLPKCRHNYTIGIKLPWTLQNEENWNKTHRMASKIWVGGGVVLMATAFLPESVMMIGFIVVIVLLTGVPTIYSYVYYRKQVKDGSFASSELMSPKATAVTKAFWILGLVVLVIVGAVLVTGDIHIQYGEESFTIVASYWGDREVAYEEIDSIEYRTQDDPGARTSGFGSLRLLMGTFQNTEFGTYTRYSYAKCQSCVVLRIDDRTLVLGGVDEESTREIYEKLEGYCP